MSTTGIENVPCHYRTSTGGQTRQDGRSSVSLGTKRQGAKSGSNEGEKAEGACVETHLLKSGQRWIGSIQDGGHGKCRLEEAEVADAGVTVRHGCLVL
jgi:hypothetical protein